MPLIRNARGADLGSMGPSRDSTAGSQGAAAAHEPLYMRVSSRVSNLDERTRVFRAMVPARTYTACRRVG